MRRLVQLLLSPPSRFARLLIAEKRLTCDPVAPEDPMAHLPVFIEMDGTRIEGLWAIVDHLEGTYADNPMVPEDPAARAQAFRLLDWAMGPLQDGVTRRMTAFKMRDKRIAREHYKIFKAGEQIGVVTSGSFAPTYGGNIGLGYVAKGWEIPGTVFDVEIHGQLAEAEVVRRPFVPLKHKKIQ